MLLPEEGPCRDSRKGNPLPRPLPTFSPRPPRCRQPTSPPSFYGIKAVKFRLICCSGGCCLFLMETGLSDLICGIATFSMHLVLKEDRKNRRAFLSKTVNISLLFTCRQPEFETGSITAGRCVLPGFPSLESTCRPESGDGGIESSEKTV
jgi:hypothetical protein